MDFGVLPKKWSKFKVCPYFLVLTFRVNILRSQKEISVGGLCMCVWGGGGGCGARGVVVARGLHVLGYAFNFFKLIFLYRFLSNQHEIWTRYSQSSREVCYDFLSHPSCSSGFIQDILDHYTFEWQKTVFAYL